MADKLTLQHFKDEVAKEKNSNTWESHVKFYKPGYPLVELHIAWQRYAQYLAAEAWEEGFTEGKVFAIDDYTKLKPTEEPTNPYKQKEE